MWAQGLGGERWPGWEGPPRQGPGWWDPEQEVNSGRDRTEVMWMTDRWTGMGGCAKSPPPPRIQVSPISPHLPWVGSVQLNPSFLLCQMEQSFSSKSPRLGRAPGSVLSLCGSHQPPSSILGVMHAQGRPNYYWETLLSISHPIAVLKDIPVPAPLGSRFGVQSTGPSQGPELLQT